MTKIQSPRSYRIDPFDLRLFSLVADIGTITGGARLLHISVAAASTRLQNLEHAVGFSLLLRAKKGVTLTDAGATLLHHAGRIQRDFDAMYAELSNHANGMRSTVRVLCNTAAMSEYLPQRLGAFLVKNSEIDIDLRELGGQDALQAMFQERADIGIVADYVNTEGLVKRTFCLDRLVVLQPTDIGRHGSHEVQFSEIVDQAFVGLPAGAALSRFLHGQALLYGRGLHHRVRVHSVDSVVHLVADKAGIAIVPEAAARRLATAKVSVARLSDSWATRRLLLCTQKEVELGAGPRLLFDFLSNEAEECDE